MCEAEIKGLLVGEMVKNFKYLNIAKRVIRGNENIGKRCRNAVMMM